VSGEWGSFFLLDFRAENGKALPHQCQTEIHSQTEPLGCHPGQAAPWASTRIARAGAHRATGTMDPGSRCARPGWHCRVGRHSPLSARPDGTHGHPVQFSVPSLTPEANRLGAATPENIHRRPHTLM